MNRISEMDDGRPTENALLSFPLGNAMGRSQADALADSKAIPGSEASEDLWATWCGPCVSELSGFAKLRQAHPELRLLLAPMDSTVPEIEKEFRQNGLSATSFWSMTGMRRSSD